MASEGASAPTCEPALSRGAQQSLRWSACHVLGTYRPSGHRPGHLHVSCTRMQLLLLLCLVLGRKTPRQLCFTAEAQPTNMLQYILTSCHSQCRARGIQTQTPPAVQPPKSQVSGEIRCLRNMHSVCRGYDGAGVTNANAGWDPLGPQCPLITSPLTLK